MTQSADVSTPKRHCMIVFAYYPLGETRVQREAEALLARGYEVDVICLRFEDDPLFEVVRGINVYRTPMHRNLEAGFAGKLIEYLKFFMYAMLKLRSLYKEKKYGVIQVHNLPDFLVFCTFFQKIRGVPVILDIHDVMPEFYAALTERSMSSWLVKLIILQEQLSCRFASRVVTVTEPWRQALIERGVAAEKTGVVMNLADSSLFHADVQPLIEDTPPPENTFRLIYHGAQAYHHGLDLLVRAVAKVRSEIPKLRLILHGNGPYHQNLVELAEELQVADIIDFSTVFMPVADLPGFIVRADVGVIPNRVDIFAGGILPTKLLEYTALRLPAISARTPGVEAYFDESMVQLFEPENVDELAASILNLYHHPERCQDLVNQSEDFIAKYNWPTHSAEYVSMVDRLNGW